MSTVHASRFDVSIASPRYLTQSTICNLCFTKKAFERPRQLRWKKHHTVRQSVPPVWEVVTVCCVTGRIASVFNLQRDTLQVYEKIRARIHKAVPIISRAQLRSTFPCVCMKTWILVSRLFCSCMESRFFSCLMYALFTVLFYTKVEGLHFSVHKGWYGCLLLKAFETGVILSASTRFHYETV